jgi:hypothetical protein
VEASIGMIVILTELPWPCPSFCALPALKWARIPGVEGPPRTLARLSTRPCGRMVEGHCAGWRPV